MPEVPEGSARMRNPFLAPVRRGDILGARRWKGFSLSTYTISELSAIGAASTATCVPILAAHGALVIPLGLVSGSRPGRRRRLRAAGALLVGLAASDLRAPLFPMHGREALARGEG